jgi:hypothetical protein
VYFDVLNMGCMEQGVLLTNSLAHVAQSVEHILGKDEVTSSILVVGSITVK